MPDADPTADLPPLPAPTPRTPLDLLELLRTAETIAAARGRAAAEGFILPFAGSAEGQRLLTVCRHIGTAPTPFTCLRLALAVAGARFAGDREAALRMPLASFLDALEEAEAGGKLLPLPAVPSGPAPPPTVCDLFDSLEQGDVTPLAEDPAADLFLAACGRAGRDSGDPAAALRAFVLDELAAGGKVEDVLDRTLGQLLGGPTDAGGDDWVIASQKGLLEMLGFSGHFTGKLRKLASLGELRVIELRPVRKGGRQLYAVPLDDLRRHRARHPELRPRRDLPAAGQPLPPIVEYRRIPYK